MEFPRLVYKGPAVHLLVESQEEFDAALAAGWFASVPESLSKPDTALDADETTAATPEEITQKLTELGVVFDRRLGPKKLAALLEETLKPPPG